MKNTPIERNVIDETINEFQIVDFSKATIREVKAIASKAEATSGVEFIKMEMGVPGLPASAVGVKAEIEALQNGIASLYIILRESSMHGRKRLRTLCLRFCTVLVQGLKTSRRHMSWRKACGNITKKEMTKLH